MKKRYFINIHSEFNAALVNYNLLDKVKADDKYYKGVAVDELKLKPFMQRTLNGEILIHTSVEAIVRGNLSKSEVVRFTKYIIKTIYEYSYEPIKVPDPYSSV